MTTFQASKYDFENDKHKRGIGDTIIVDDIEYVIVEASFLTTKDIFLMDGKDIDSRGYDEVICEQHPERQFVYLIYYVNRKEVNLPKHNEQYNQNSLNESGSPETHGQTE